MKDNELEKLGGRMPFNLYWLFCNRHSVSEWKKRIAPLNGQFYTDSKAAVDPLIFHSKEIGKESYGLTLVALLNSVINLLFKAKNPIYTFNAAQGIISENKFNSRQMGSLIHSLEVTMRKIDKLKGESYRKRFLYGAIFSLLRFISIKKNSQLNLQQISSLMDSLTKLMENPRMSWNNMVESAYADAVRFLERKKGFICRGEVIDTILIDSGNGNMPSEIANLVKRFDGCSAGS